jgi:anthranilate phosphoribosyltransferase
VSETLKTTLKILTEGGDLASEQMRAAMEQVMTGEATPAQIAGFLIALRMKGETIDEIAAAAQVMRQLASRVETAPDGLVDIVGTGGDAQGTFNISTATSLVAAAAGARVAKHGNRSVSSRSGSADVLEAAGINLNLSPEQVAECIDAVGIGFMFAPLHHSAMRHAVGPRREMGVRTLLNLLGPLSNPANAPNQLLGVYSSQWLRPFAEALAQLGSRHVMVVCSDDGLDEISHAAPTRVAELRDGAITEYRIEPADFGVTAGSLEDLCVDDVPGSLARVRHALEGASEPAADIVALNAGAALYLAGRADDLASGVVLARSVMMNGAATAKLNELIAFTQGFADGEHK